MQKLTKRIPLPLRIVASIVLVGPKSGFMK